MEDLDEEDSYEVLRRAVEEYRATMREYYKAVSSLFRIPSLHYVIVVSPDVVMLVCLKFCTFSC